MAPVPTPSTAARAHYSRGLEFYALRDYARALAELERAYALVPSAKLLFAIGQSQAGLGQYAKASLSLSRYLHGVGTSVQPERRAQVERQLAALRLQTGQLYVTVNRAGAAIRVDEVEVGSSPLPGPLLLDVGPHRVRVSSARSVPSTTVARITAGTVTPLHVELPSAAPKTGRSLAVPLWVSSGVLAALTVGTAIFTFEQRHDYVRSLARPQLEDPARSSRSLDRQRTRLGRWLLATDILAGATVASGAAALYFSFSPVGAGEDDLARTPRVGGFLATAQGTF